MQRPATLADTLALGDAGLEKEREGGREREREGR